MPRRNIPQSQKQSQFLTISLETELDHKHPIYQMRSLIDWEELLIKVSPYIEVKQLGRDRHCLRVLLGLMLLQQMVNVSDASASIQLKENIYWQYFCGYEYIEKEVKVSESCIRRFRQSLGEDGLEIVLQAILKLGLKSGALKKKTSKK